MFLLIILGCSTINIVVSCEAMWLKICLIALPNTVKKVKNIMSSRIFLTNFELFGNVV